MDHSWVWFLKQITKNMTRHVLKYQVSQKEVYPFGGLWNEEYVADILNCNAGLSVKVNLDDTILFIKIDRL